MVSIGSEKMKLIYINTKNMSREDWLKERRKAIGGSDAAAIIGLNAYATPYTVWADKTGRLPEKPDNEAMRQGRDLEQYVVDRFTELTGKRARKLNAIIKNPEYPWASANIDRDIIGEKAGLECKTTSVLNLKKFAGGEFPENYYVQCVHYLAITGKNRWYLAVLVLNQGFMVYQITRRKDDRVPDWCSGSVYVSQDEITALMDAEQEFWKLVESDTPPMFSGTQADTAALSAIYAGGRTERVELFGRESLIHQYRSLKERVKALETELDQCVQTLKGDLGDSEEGQAGSYLVSWKPQSRRIFDAKAFATDHPDIDLESYFKTSNFRKFDIKQIMSE